MSDIVTLNGYKIKDEKAIRSYETVALMKADTKLKEGYHVKTKGYYEANDGGHGEYVIVDDDTLVDDGGSIHVLNNGLRATLIHNGKVNVKQFGAYGDGTHNDTNAFIKALENGDIVYVNSTTNNYKVTHLVIPTGKSLIGNDERKVQINLDRNGDTVISTMYNNSKMENIFINALDEDLSNNRFDLNNKSNVVINNCQFSGFRNPTNSNSWGLLLTSAKYITISNCYFSNNTQSDIAIVSGCENIKIENCTGLSFHINMEPPAIPYIKNVSIDNCLIAKLDIRENNYLYNIIQGVTVKDCIIDLLEYDGGRTTLIDCIVKAYQPQDSSIQFGGVLEFINTGNFSENLLTDPYIDNYTFNNNFSTPWGDAYIPIGIQLALNYTKIGEENILELNQSNSKAGVSIKHKPINIDINKTYVLKIRGGAYYPTGSANISKIARIEWMDNNEEILQTQEPSFFRAEQNSTVPIHDEYLILKPYQNSTKLQIVLRNSPYGIQTLKIASVELFELYSNEIYTTQLKSLPINKKRVFTGSTADSSINYDVGDIMYYETPTTYIGKVRTVGGYSGTWKDFGDISS